MKNNLKIELRKQNWRKFVDSNNPIAAVLLAKMGYNKKEAKEVRLAYLRMILRLRTTLDDARMALIMSVADLYFKPSKDEDDRILKQITEQYPEEGVNLMELMPAWKRWGYEEGLEEGIEKGMEKGMREVTLRLINSGMSLEEVSHILKMPLEELESLIANDK